MLNKCALILAVLFMNGAGLAQNISAAPTTNTPEIYLIGSVHHMHFEERYHYSLIDLQAQIQSLRPDVVCGEITPEAFNGPMEGNFPPEAAMLAETVPAWGARFVPADWRISLAWQDRASKQVAEDKQKTAEMEAVRKKVRASIAGFSGESLYDHMNGSAEYLAVIDNIYEQVIGENTPFDISAGAWHERNRMIVENCLLQASNARRIVLVFGNDHLPQLRRQLAARGLTGQIPPRAFTPAGLGTMSPAVVARWQRNLKNLEGIAEGSISVSGDMRAKVKDTNRIPVLRTEIEIYLKRRPVG